MVYADRLLMNLRMPQQIQSAVIFFKLVQQISGLGFQKFEFLIYRCHYVCGCINEILIASEATSAEFKKKNKIANKTMTDDIAVRYN